MLVTVGMAHVGYDHKPIAVAAVLNGVREFNWLDSSHVRRTYAARSPQQ
jgi:hypothetical protein